MYACRIAVGSTGDLQRRMQQHQSKKHTYSTKRLGDLKLIFWQKYSTLGEARSVENKLKKLKRKDYIIKIIEEGIIKVKP